MKPELLLSVDSKQSFWIDPRTKLYMVKADSGIGTLFPPAFGQ